MAYKGMETVAPRKPFKMVTGEVPAAPPGLVWVKVAFAGVCHSDVHISQDHLGTTAMFGDDKFPGMVLGHEISGYIDEAGPGVDLHALGLKQGDPVMVYPWVACGNCETCYSGYSNMCSDPKGNGNYIGCGPFAKGGYQTHLLTKPQNLLKVPDSLPMDIACMLPCSAGTSYSALRKLTEAIQFSQKRGTKARLLVIGAGGLGLWTIQLAKVMFGADKIHVVAADIEQTKLDIAKQFGADETVLWNMDAEQATSVQDTIKNGMMHAAVDLVATDASSGIGVRSLESYGALVLVGLRGGNFQAQLVEIVFNQVTIRGSKVFCMEEFKEVVELVAQNKLSYPALEYHRLEEVYEIIQKLMEGKINGRAIIKY